ncbi:3-phosphoshikimate 1-carboxyvinyltransferase [Alicyclobacillus contaminans]|uniref:3-phosphoshikimate 1-carboxyvinyltransferase n=1 Tax=Alicyclobacillus contaminans TaxID=392016 RepID=UPI000428E02E|nr:3-phosphoshikimate 1-carboxyvinyltransferase [Alicyclobacillus contaminans]GMA48695.1 3-phosphoshikimate 1-carboxyvinyltransferase [Alicyclobacillus contaminans]
MIPSSETIHDTMRFAPVSGLHGCVSVPGDKSITHRGILFGLIADGTTTVRHWLDAGDCRSSIRVARALGAEIAVEDDILTIRGTGGELREPDDVLDCGNSGTTIRLLLGILAGRVPFACLTGDASLRRRPMARVLSPLAQMGAQIIAREGKYAPLAVVGRALTGIEYRLPVASAQLKSAVLLAGLLAASGDTTVTEDKPTRNHTETMLRAFGAPLQEATVDGVHRVTVSAGGRLRGTEVVVPGDISSAAFILAAAAIVLDSEVTVAGVGLNATRTGFLEVLKRMGGQVRITNQRVVAGEPIGDVTVSSSGLSGTAIGGPEIPTLIDELPILAVLAAFAEGDTVVSDAEELRVKESDRIRAVVQGLTAIGVEAEERPDGFVVHGRGPKGVQGGVVNSFDDHRIAMSFAVAGLGSARGVELRNWSCVGISYPTFQDTLRNIGANV